MNTGFSGLMYLPSKLYNFSKRIRVFANIFLPQSPLVHFSLVRYLTGGIPISTRPRPGVQLGPILKNIDASRLLVSEGHYMLLRYSG